MLNNALDWDAIQRAYNKDKRIIIRDVLEPDFADEVFHCLSVDIEWELYFLTEEGPTIFSADELKRITPEQKAGIGQKLTEMSGKGFSYFYHRHEMDNNLHPIMKELFDLMSGPDVLEFVKHISSDQTLDRMNVVATRYTPSCFLRTHNDFKEKSARRVGHLWGFTRNWNPDWGGILQFPDGDRGIIEGHIPEFNTLTLFKVPVTHFVSQVTAYARTPRFVLSGWFHDEPYPDDKEEISEIYK